MNLPHTAAARQRRVAPKRASSAEADSLWGVELLHASLARLPGGESGPLCVLRWLGQDGKTARLCRSRRFDSAAPHFCAAFQPHPAPVGEQLKELLWSVWQGMPTASPAG